MGCCIGNSCNCCVGNCGDCGGKAARELKERHEKKIAGELEEQRKIRGENAKNLEQDLMNYINNSMAEFLTILSRANKDEYGGKKLEINVNKLEEKKEALEKEVVGYVWNALDNRLHQKDAELSVILAEQDDDLRNQRFREFADSIEKKAKQDLKVKIKNVVDEQYEIVSKELSLRIEEVNRSLMQATDEYNKILSVDKTDTKALEQMQLDYQYKYDIYSLIHRVAEER